MVKPEINSAADLKGKTLASPQLGGTQDVALRAWLAGQGYKTNVDGSGDVAINPTENAQTLKLFQDGKLDGAWLPEPWASRLVLQAGAKVLVDEKDLWDGTRHRQARRVPHHHPDREPEVRCRPPGHRQGAAEGPREVRGLAQQGLRRPRRPASSTRPCKESAGADARRRRPGPLPGEHHVHPGPAGRKLPPAAGRTASTAGTTKQADINGIFDLRALNEVAAATGTSKISAAGLGQD